jgi:hypothetical protein
MSEYCCGILQNYIFVKIREILTSEISREFCKICGLKFREIWVEFR